MKRLRTPFLVYVASVFAAFKAMESFNGLRSSEDMIATLMFGGFCGLISASVVALFLSINWRAEPVLLVLGLLTSAVFGIVF